MQRQSNGCLRMLQNCLSINTNLTFFSNSNRLVDSSVLLEVISMDKIGKHEVKLKPIEPKPIQFDKDGRKEIYLNVKGERLEKIPGRKDPDKWVNTVTQQEHDHKAKPPAKSVNGKPTGTHKKTKIVESYEQCDVMEIFNYAKNTKSYHVIGDSLKQELILSKKAISFQYNPGRNYLGYKAVVYYDVLKQAVIMRCLSGNMTEVNFNDNSSDAVVETVEKAEPLVVTI